MESGLEPVPESIREPAAAPYPDEGRRLELGLEKEGAVFVAGGTALRTEGAAAGAGRLLDGNGGIVPAFGAVFESEGDPVPVDPGMEE